MSFITCIASDSPISDVKNTHVKQLSVNEALETDAGVPEFLLDSSDTDKDDPDVILWVDSKEGLGEISIKRGELAHFLSDDGTLPATELHYFSSLEWLYSEQRANMLINHIKNHLEKANEVEIWHIWLGTEGEENRLKIKRHNVRIDELKPIDFENLLIKGQYDCLAVKRFAG